MVNANRGATGFDSSEFEDEYDRPSKTQIKREMVELQKLGAEIVKESKDRVARVPMPDDLRHAIMECQRLKNNEAIRRQVQFIGKKMRSLSEDDVAAMRKVVASWRGTSKAETAALHLLERRREKLLKSDAALTELIAEHQDVDVPRIRSLIRNARKEQAEQKPPKAYRELFQVLRQLNNASSNEDVDAHDEDA